jgi:hypothetical protein
VAALLDSLMPSYDLREVHELMVDAPREAAWAALHQVGLREMPMFRALIAIRQQPLPFAHTERKLFTRSDRPLLAEMLSGPFVPLAQRPPSELVIGLLARPWRPDGSMRRVDTQGFVAFEEPGWAKTVLGFRLEEVGRRTRIVTETRVRTTDTSTRRRFRAYWFVISWGSAATRRAWLRAIKRRAERESVVER